MFSKGEDWMKNNKRQKEEFERSQQPSAGSVGYDSEKIKRVVEAALLGIESLKIQIPVNLALNLQRAHAELKEARDRIYRHES